MAADGADRDVGRRGHGQGVIGAGVDNRADTGGRCAGDGHLHLAAILEGDFVARSRTLHGDAGKGMSRDRRAGNDGGAIGLERKDERAFVDGDASRHRELVDVAQLINARGIGGQRH